jgi:hypothetical protein
MFAVFAVVVGVAGVGGCLWWMQRDMAGLRAEIDRRIDARMTDRLQDAWEHIGRSQAEHAWHVDARMQRAEEAVARIAGDQARLDQRLEVVETWVRHWAAG